MSALNQVDYAIQFGSTCNPNPYEQDADVKTLLNMQEKVSEVMDKLKYEVVASDYLDDAWEIFDQMKTILYDKEDDKEGRLHDLIDQKFESYARWLVTSGNTSATIPLKRKLGVL
jgi:polysaccharide pyruvyl transferase WcaK-like protein